MIHFWALLDNYRPNDFIFLKLGGFQGHNITLSQGKQEFYAILFFKETTLNSVVKKN